MDLRQFLQLTVTSPVEGYFNLSFAPQRGNGFWEDFYRWPQDIERVLDVALDHAEDSNVYFSSYLWSKPSSTKDGILPTRTIQADLDNADILTLPIQPSILVETSKNRHQGYWFLKEALDPEVHEVLSRKLTYAIKDADTSGWPLGRRVRVPYTFNFKYLEGPQQIKVISASLKEYGEEDIDLLEEPPSFIMTPKDVEFLDALSGAGVIVGNAIGPQELFASIQHKLRVSTKSQYNIKQSDRSKALWGIMCDFFRAGLSREEVWWLAWNSANNKFAELRYHAERELAKDVLRCEAAVKSKIVDEREMIAEARRLPGLTHEKRQHLLQLVMGFMRAAGDFIHTSDDTCWYVRHDLGRPIMISSHSEWMSMILDLQFGLNGSEADKTYVAIGLENFCRSLPINAINQALSYYDSGAKHLLLHTGRKEVLCITSNSIDRVTDGAYGVVFPWLVGSELFLPKLNEPATNWEQVLFGNALQNAIGIEPNQGIALLRVWLLFLLFRSTAVSRPILAFLGQPGAGKSTLFRRIYALVYGRGKSVTKVTTPDNLDQALATDPFIVLDNVDTPEKWLPDRLALAASASDIQKRKLYTDADTYLMKCQAIVGITAHNPRFTREDVADRMIILTFKRLDSFLPEGDILDAISRDRNKLWGGIVLDCQRVLQQPMPSHSETPQFRVEDFARTGYWIAKALGVAREFSQALKIVSKSARDLNLDEDQVLVNALRAFVDKGKGEDWRTPGSLWAELPLYATDMHSFQKLYRGAVYLGKKLLVLQDSLKEVFNVEVKYDANSSTRQWRFRVK